MPEAVIVDTVRTPIGRAFKGSLAQLRPEETAAYVVDQLLERNPDVDPSWSRTSTAAAACPRACRRSTSPGSSSCCPRSSRRDVPERRSRATAPRPSTRSATPRNAVKAGEGDAYIAAGVEWVSRFNERTEPAGAADQNEKLQGENGQPNAYIEMGLTAVNVAKKYEVSRADMDKYAQRSQELAVAVAGGRLLRPRDRPGEGPRRQRGRQGRRPARELDAGEARPSCPRRSRAAAASPPATPAR